MSIKGKGKGTARPKTVHEGPEWEVEVYLYFFFNLGAAGVGG
jgi:hypothetical protein